jgi:outer membrane murein-binding lipoprotein Lpp
MRRIFISLIASGLLLVSGVAASAKFDSNASDTGQIGQHQNQTQTDKKATPAAKATDKAETKPATPAPATKPATPAAKPATTTSQTAQAACGETGDNTGDHQNDDRACKDQNEQAGVNEAKTEANDPTETPGTNQQGDNQD